MRPLVYRWRALTPLQAAEIRRCHADGSSAVQLATRYGVTVRTIYRAIRRSEMERRVVRVFGLKATFEWENEHPIQVTPWVPV